MAAPSASRKSVNLRILKGILTEIRHIYSKEKWRSSPMTVYVLDQYRAHQVTSEKVCRAEPEMRHLAMTYKCYLESVRKNEELNAMYKGKGERTVKDTAGLVGFGLPNTPKDET